MSGPTLGTASWRIRTVYDADADKRAGGRFSAQVRLLAATWQYWVEDPSATPLEIVCVGGEVPGPSIINVTNTNPNI